MCRQRIIVLAIAGSLLACVAGNAAATRLDYTLTLGIAHNDNINLSDDDPISGNILTPGLGFSLSNDGATIQAHANGSIQYNHYLGGHFADSTRSQLAGLVNWNMVPHRLTWTFADNLSVQPINELQPDTPSNQQQTNVFAMGPTLFFELGPTTHGQAELRYADSYAEKTKEFNSNRVSAALRAIKDLNPVSQLSANIQAQQVKFDQHGAAADYDRYDVYAEYTRKLAHVDLDVALGYTKLDLQGGADNTGGALVRGTFNWHASQRSSFMLGLARQFTDAAGALSIAPGAIGSPPTDITTGDATVSPQTYLEKRLELAYRFEGTRLGFSVAPYYFKRDYTGTSTLDQRGRGINAGLDWKLRPRLDLGFHANYEKHQYDLLGRDDSNLTTGASLAYQWTEHLSWHLDLTHYQRNSSVFSQDSTQNIVYFWVAWTR